MIEEKKTTKKALPFKEFVISQLQKQERVQNILLIIFQDFYLWVQRIATVGHIEWFDMDKAVDSVLNSPYVQGDVGSVREDIINQWKDRLIRELAIMELMRQ